VNNLNAQCFRPWVQYDGKGKSIETGFSTTVYFNDTVTFKGKFHNNRVLNKKKLIDINKSNDVIYYFFDLEKKVLYKCFNNENETYIIDKIKKKIKKNKREGTFVIKIINNENINTKFYINFKSETHIVIVEYNKKTKNSFVSMGRVSGNFRG